MKPMGAIPADWTAAKLAVLAATIGETPAFVYDLAIVRARVARFRVAMPEQLQLHYAIKANPYAPLLLEIAKIVDGFDVASGGEMEMALAAGVTPSHISIAGPGKRDAELAAAIEAGITINLESEGEADRALAQAGRLGTRPRVAVRVNPDFEIKGSGMRMGGGAKPFGVDAARVPALVRRLVEAGADWRGFHIFAGSQALDAGAIITAERETVALAAQLAEAAGHAPRLVNLGGGFGIPYFPGEVPLDIEAVGSALAETIESRHEILADSRFAIELGRWLVGEAGVYFTRIIDRKESHGEIFLVVDGGLHHQLAASGNFGTVVRRNYPVAIVGGSADSSEEIASIVGCLCTPLDRLADKIMMPRADVGDVVAIFMAGAYGATASPQAFLGHPAPNEILADGGILMRYLTQP